MPRSSELRNPIITVVLRSPLLEGDLRTYLEEKERMDDVHIFCERDENNKIRKVLQTSELEIISDNPELFK